jgi:hypothetical protein
MFFESPVQVRVADVTSTGSIAMKHIYEHYLPLWVGDSPLQYLRILNGMIGVSDRSGSISLRLETVC